MSLLLAKARRLKVKARENTHCEYTSADGYCCTSVKSGITSCQSHRSAAPDVYERIRRDWTIVGDSSGMTNTTGKLSDYSNFGLAQVSWNMNPFKQNIRAWSDYAQKSSSAVGSTTIAAASVIATTLPPGVPTVFSVSLAGDVSKVPINLDVAAIAPMLTAPVVTAPPATSIVTTAPVAPEPIAVPTIPVVTPEPATDLPSTLVPAVATIPTAVAAATLIGPPTMDTAPTINYAGDIVPPLPDRTTSFTVTDRGFDFDAIRFLTDDALREGPAIISKIFPDNNSTDMVLPIQGMPVKYRGGTQKLFYFSDMPNMSAEVWKRLNREAATKAEHVGSLNVICGAGDNDDVSKQTGNIWYIQNDPANKGALFQVASNFNSLEQAAHDSTPGMVSKYFGDNTQGPKATLCTFPATLWRRYAWSAQIGASAPDDVTNYKSYPGVMVKSDLLNVYANLETTIGGWLDTTKTTYTAPETDTADQEFMLGEIIACAYGIGALGITNCDSLMRQNVDNTVTLLGKPNMVHQILTSAVDMINGPQGSFKTINEKIVWSNAALLAAYSNTLFFAWKNRIEKVFLTLIGGGVFGNQHSMITNMIIKAMRIVSLYSINEGSDFHTKMNVNIVLYDANEKSKMLDGSEGALKDVVDDVVKKMHEHTHHLFYHVI